MLERYRGQFEVIASESELLKQLGVIAARLEKQLEIINSSIDEVFLQRLNDANKNFEKSEIPADLRRVLEEKRAVIGDSLFDVFDDIDAEFRKIARIPRMLQNIAMQLKRLPPDDARNDLLACVESKIHNNHHLNDRIQAMGMQFSGLKHLELLRDVYQKLDILQKKEHCRESLARTRVELEAFIQTKIFPEHISRHNIIDNVIEGIRRHAYFDVSHAPESLQEMFGCWCDDLSADEVLFKEKLNCTFQAVFDHLGAVMEVETQQILGINRFFYQYLVKAFNEALSPNKRNEIRMFMCDYCLYVSDLVCETSVDYKKEVLLNFPLLDEKSYLCLAGLHGDLCRARDMLKPLREQVVQGAHDDVVMRSVNRAFRFVLEESHRHLGAGINAIFGVVGGVDGLYKSGSDEIPYDIIEAFFSDYDSQFSLVMQNIMVGHIARIYNACSQILDGQIEKGMACLSQEAIRHQIPLDTITDMSDPNSPLIQVDALKNALAEIYDITTGSVYQPLIVFPRTDELIIQYLQSDNVAKQSRGIEALYCLGAEFKGNSPIRFIDVMQKVKGRLLSLTHVPDYIGRKVESIGLRYDYYQCTPTEEDAFAHYMRADDGGSLYDLIKGNAPYERVKAKIMSSSTAEVEESANQLSRLGSLRCVYSSEKLLLIDQLESRILRENIPISLIHNLIQEELWCADTVFTHHMLTKQWIDGINVVMALLQPAGSGDITSYGLEQLIQYCPDRFEGLLTALEEKSENCAELKGLYKAALVIAVRKGNSKIVELMLHRGVSADLRAEGSDKYTVLHLAVLEGHLNVVHLLLENGALVDLRTQGSDECTALHIAASYGHAKIIQLLLNRGAFVDERDKSTHQYTALHIASIHGYARAVELLLQNEAGVDLREVDGDQFMALHCAAGNGHAEVVRLLLEHGAFVNERIKNECEYTALHIAVTYAHIDVVRTLLLRKGVFIDARDKTIHQYTALHIAVIIDNAEIVQLLLENGISVNLPEGSAYKSTPLHIAASKGLAAVVEALLNGGAFVDSRVQNSKRNTPLHYAVIGGHADVVRLLLKGKASVDLREGGESQCSALHIAVVKGNTLVVKALLDGDADISLVTENGENALDLATRLGDRAIITMIEEDRDARVSLTHVTQSPLCLCLQRRD